MCLTTIVVSWFGKQMTMMNFSSLSKVNFPRFKIEFFGVRHTSLRPTLVLQKSEKPGNHVFKEADVTSQTNVTPYHIRT